MRCQTWGWMVVAMVVIAAFRTADCSRTRIEKALQRITLRNMLLSGSLSPRALHAPHKCSRRCSPQKPDDQKRRPSLRRPNPTPEDDKWVGSFRVTNVSTPEIRDLSRRVRRLMDREGYVHSFRSRFLRRVDKEQQGSGSHLSDGALQENKREAGDELLERHGPQPRDPDDPSFLARDAVSRVGKPGSGRSKLGKKTLDDMISSGRNRNEQVSDDEEFYPFIDRKEAAKFFSLQKSMSKQKQWLLKLSKMLQKDEGWRDESEDPLSSLQTHRERLSSDSDEITGESSSEEDENDDTDNSKESLDSEDRDYDNDERFPDDDEVESSEETDDRRRPLWVEARRLRRWGRKHGLRMFHGIPRHVVFQKKELWRLRRVIRRQQRRLANANRRWMTGKGRNILSLKPMPPDHRKQAYPEPFIKRNPRKKLRAGGSPVHGPLPARKLASSKSRPKSAKRYKPARKTSAQRLRWLRKKKHWRRLKKQRKNRRRPKKRQEDHLWKFENREIYEVTSQNNLTTSPTTPSNADDISLMQSTVTLPDAQNHTTSPEGNAVNQQTAAEQSEKNVRPASSESTGSVSTSNNRVSSDSNGEEFASPSLRGEGESPLVPVRTVYLGTVEGRKVTGTRVDVLGPAEGQEEEDNSDGAMYLRVQYRRPKNSAAGSYPVSERKKRSTDDDVDGNDSDIDGDDVDRDDGEVHGVVTSSGTVVYGDDEGGDTSVTASRTVVDDDDDDGGRTAWRRFRRRRVQGRRRRRNRRRNYRRPLNVANTQTNDNDNDDDDVSRPQRRRHQRRQWRYRLRQRQRISADPDDDDDNDNNDNDDVLAPVRRRRLWRRRQRFNTDLDDDDDDDNDGDDNNGDSDDARGVGFVQLAGQSSSNRQRGGTYYRRRQELRRNQRRRHRYNRRQRHRRLRFQQRRRQQLESLSSDSDDNDDGDDVTTDRDRPAERDDVSDSRSSEDDDDDDDNDDVTTDRDSSTEDGAQSLPQFQTIGNNNNNNNDEEAEAYIRSPFINHRTAYDFLSTQARQGSRSRGMAARGQNELRDEQWQFSHRMSESLCEVFDKHFVPTAAGGRCD